MPKKTVIDTPEEGLGTKGDVTKTTKKRPARTTKTTTKKSK